jgi:xanthine dehydrogenase YagS FAD-binding subunit
MQPFEWVTVRSEAEAANAGATTVAAAMAEPTVGREALVLKAGGIDLVNLMKQGLLQPRRLANLRGVNGLDRIVEESDGALRIGALATLVQVAQHPLVRNRYGALADATANLASPQIRNVATLGGNLLQRPQCWYFRSAQHVCARKGGSTCFAFGGENQYHAVFEQNGCAIVHPSTAATALVALGAIVELIDAKGSRRAVRLEDFYVRPDQDIHRENDLKPGELLTAVLLPKPAAGTRSVHLKQGEKDSFDWPLADVAVALRRNASGICQDASVVLGAAAAAPHRARAAETALQGKPVDETTARNAARAALEGATPLSKNAYKLPIFEALVRRAILAAQA